MTNGGFEELGPCELTDWGLAATYHKDDSATYSVADRKLPLRPDSAAFLRILTAFPGGLSFTEIYDELNHYRGMSWEEVSAAYTSLSGVLKVFGVADGVRRYDTSSNGRVRSVYEVTGLLYDMAPDGQLQSLV